MITAYLKLLEKLPVSNNVIFCGDLAGLDCFCFLFRIC